MRLSLSHLTVKSYTVTVVFLQRRRQRFRDIKAHAYGCTARRLWSRDVNPQAGGLRSQGAVSWEGGRPLPGHFLRPLQLMVLESQAQLMIQLLPTWASLLKISVSTSLALRFNSRYCMHIKHQMIVNIFIEA